MDSTVRIQCGWTTFFSLMPGAIIDRVINLDCILTVSSELAEHKEAASKEVIGRFIVHLPLLPVELLLTSSSKLVTELAKLDEISKQAMWKMVLDNQETKNKIEGSFRQINEHMKDLQVLLLTYLLECINMLI